MQRRTFLFSAVAALAAQRPSLRFGHRQANMVTEAGPGVFDLAKQIHGLSGVELQVFFKGTTLWDDDTWRMYQRAALNTGLTIPSLAGVWPPGAGLPQPSAEENIRKAIHAAENLHATTILVACFEQNCPNMDRAESYGPVVALLRKLAPAARDAGVVISLETSNSPADDRKLIDLVESPSVRIYLDLFNVEHYQHTGESVPGITLLGNRVRQVHMKNEDRLLADPGPVNFAAAAKALRQIGYPGWVVFETSHTSPAQCIEATEKNITFISGNFKS